MIVNNRDDEKEIGILKRNKIKWGIIEGQLFGTCT